MTQEITLSQRLEDGLMAPGVWPFLEPGTEDFIKEIGALEEDDRRQIRNLVVAANVVIRLATKFPENIEVRKEGAAVAIYNTELGIPPIVFCVGNLDKPDSEFGTKEAKYMLFALAKALLLKANPDFRGSYQNCVFYDTDTWRINGVDIPAGAVRHGESGKWIVAVSGFTPVLLDEICALGILAKSEVIATEDAISYYDNTFIEKDFPESLVHLREIVGVPTT